MFAWNKLVELQLPNFFFIYLYLYIQASCGNCSNEALCCEWHHTQMEIHGSSDTTSTLCVMSKMDPHHFN